MENYRPMNAQKKSGYPTQPGNRSADPRQQRKRKYRTIIYQIKEKIKRVKWTRIGILCLVLLGVCYTISCAINASRVVKGVTVTDPPMRIIFENQPAKQVEYIFRDGEGTPVDMQAMTNAWAAEAGYAKRYDMTDAERWEVASVVTAEAGGEPYAGMMAVAQCILQSCEDDGIRPDEAVVTYQYTKNRPEPSAEALEAVQAVFDFGQVVTTEPIKYFYAHKITYSEWHESQEYVITINNHRFYAEKETEK
jgi:hypothetical protein